MSSNANSPDNSKANSQRQYREKETDGFQELRHAISQVTGERDVTGTRHEILTKAAQSIRELNQHNAELRRQLMAISNSSRGTSGGVQGYGPMPGLGGNDASYYAGTYGSVASPRGNGNYMAHPGQARHA